MHGLQLVRLRNVNSVEADEAGALGQELSHQEGKRAVVEIEGVVHNAQIGQLRELEDTHDLLH